jgi:hypothetical protein
MPPAPALPDSDGKSQLWQNRTGTMVMICSLFSNPALSRFGLQNLSAFISLELERYDQACTEYQSELVCHASKESWKRTDPPAVPKVLPNSFIYKPTDYRITPASSYAAEHLAAHLAAQQLPPESSHTYEAPG